MIRVKICGITSVEDALCAIKEGVSALGFNFYPSSPRYIDPSYASRIIKKLPPFVSIVGLFVNQDREIIRKIADMCGLDTIQFHGDEPPDFCHEFKKWRVIKAFRIKDKNDLEQINNYDVNGYLLDSFHPNRYGGTGLSFQWDILDSLRQDNNALIIAGGINITNVEDLLTGVIPYGIDVCSGVEKEPGIKEHHLIKQLMIKVNSFGK